MHKLAGLGFFSISVQNPPIRLTEVSVCVIYCVYVCVIEVILASLRPLSVPRGARFKPSSSRLN